MDVLSSFLGYFSTTLSPIVLSDLLPALKGEAFTVVTPFIKQVEIF